MTSSPQSKTSRAHISVVSPVYGAATLLGELVDRIERSVSTITQDYEIILVDDDSPDDCWTAITALAESHPHLIGIRLARNFGQQYALNCGLDHATGEYVVTLDCDLQDPPEEIPKLYEQAQAGVDIVLARRTDRKDDPIKRVCSRLFYAVLNCLTGTQQDPAVANFVLYRRRAIVALARLGDYYRYYPTMVHWIGFNRATVDIPHAVRSDGKRSSYSFRKRAKLAFETIISFSDKPLRLAVGLGVTISLLSALAALILILGYVSAGTRVAGWASVFLSLWFLAGLIISTLGLVGLYVGKIFETVKGRPTYIVSETVNSPTSG
jgi:glycosyltransferase involved in cell wall biosynthesis